MARGALNWGVHDLAGKADVAINTISRYENGADMLAGTLAKIKRTLEAEGIDFPDDFTVSIRRMKAESE